MIEVEGTPLRLRRLLNELQTGLRQSLAALLLVAAVARENAVRPASDSASRTSHYVVYGQVGRRLHGLAAILAGVVVPLEDVPAVEGYADPLEVVVSVEYDHFRDLNQVAY